DADTSGPRALMLAVLEDAVRCIENGRWQRRFGARRLAAEAEVWVRSDRADWPFSFLNVCEALGIDVDALRSRLLIRHPAGERPAYDRPGHKEAAMVIAIAEGRRSCTSRYACSASNTKVHHNTRKETDR